MEISDKIRTARESLRLSQAALADLVGTSGTQVGRWERAEGEPPAGMAVKLARALHLPLDYLCDESIDAPGPRDDLTEEERYLLRVARDLKGGAATAARLVINAPPDAKLAAGTPLGQPRPAAPQPGRDLQRQDEVTHGNH